MPYRLKIIGIYKIVNTKNNKIYVGSAVSILNRFTQHRHLLNKNKHFNNHLQSSWNFYGKDIFNFEIIEECSLEELKNKEEYYIKKHNTTDRNFGYNKRLDCSTNLGIKMSMEIREKLRQSHLGHKRSSDAHNKILKSQYKSVIQIDSNFNIVDIYESIKNASEITKCCEQSISLCAKKKMRSHPKNIYFWCFKTDFVDIESFKKYIKEWKK